ncbi:MAG: penicillin-binding protein 2 [Candidatus Krumholzibacteriota bacterium]|nr:penicillin-binding protein 2 [Candidatus Krumholzibacteriota bacterium]
MDAADRQSEGALRRRLILAVVVVAAVMLVLVIRLFHLQVVAHGHYAKLALTNRIQRERVVAPRGLIRARDGTKLVVNVPVYQISILPNKLRGAGERLGIACRWLGIDEVKLDADLAAWRERYRDGREMTVVQAADKRQISVLIENRSLFPFFRLVLKHRRQYPQGELAVHLLGYTGEVGDDDMRRASALQPGDIIGRTGIELQYEADLRGVDGVKIVEISAEGTKIGEIDQHESGFAGEGEALGSRPPVPGSDVYLTVDIELQRSIEEIFDWAKGCVVAMDPENGEVLAAVSRPGYDPNIFLEGVTRRQWQDLFGNPDNPLFNRIVQAVYPPGSIFKIVTATAALDAGVIGPRDRLAPCWGVYRFGNRDFRCWKAEGHGSLALSAAIEQSCDIFFYQIGEMLTADRFHEAGELFGLGRRTGIDLPSEARGLLPSKAYYDKRFGRGRWTKGHLLNISIGQGDLLVTPVQICVLAAVVANGGFRVTPHLVREIRSPDGRSAGSRPESPVPVRGLDRSTLALLRRSMEAVVHGEHGTARGARVAGVRVAGKTGTCQNPHGEDHALFVAYAPADDPEIVLVIVMENAGHGGAMAAPIAGRILSSRFLGVASGPARAAASSNGEVTR